MHLTAAQQAGEREVWSNHRHVPAAAAYFGLLGTVGLANCLQQSAEKGSRAAWSTHRLKPVPPLINNLTPLGGTGLACESLFRSLLEILGSHRNRPHRCVIGTDATQRVEDPRGPVRWNEEVELVKPDQAGRQPRE
jgi:hypothetical protein